ncbi:MAG: phosphatase PAP2 family protein [Anaerolineae bacterium]
MRPPENKRPFAERVRRAWQRAAPALKRLLPALRIISLAAGLLVIVALGPGYLRVVFIRGLQQERLTAGILAAGFGLLAISLVWATGQRIDTWAFLFLNVRGRRPPWLDRVMVAFTQVGSALTALAIALIFFLANYRLLAYEFITGTLTLWLFVELVKALVRRGRPILGVSQTRIVGYRNSGRSFPSGHTSQAFFMVTLLIAYFHASAWLAVLLYGLAVLVGITRMYVGAHYPRDVLAGVLLGSAWGLSAGIIDAYMRGGIA